MRSVNDLTFFLHAAPAGYRAVGSRGWERGGVEVVFLMSPIDGDVASVLGREMSDDCAGSIGDGMGRCYLCLRMTKI